MAPVSFSSVSLRNIVQALGIVTLIIFLLCYMLFQARNVIVGPKITLTQEPGVLQVAERVTLYGKAENIVKLTLNGREIYTDNEGTFSEELVLENGYTITTLAAQDRFGRTTSLTKTFVYIPATTSPQTYGV